LPRSSSLPTMNMPRSFSRSWSRFQVPDIVYQAWGKVSTTAGAMVPQRVRGFFGRGSGGYRYQNLSQEPGEVIMDDYFDHYLDDDDEDHASATVLGDSHGLRDEDGLEDAQERYRDESDEDDDGDEDLDAMV